MAKIKVTNVRLAFPCLFTPEQFNGTGDPAYSATLLLDKGNHSDQIKQIKAAIEAVAKDKWKGKAAAVLESLGTDKKCLRDGDATEYDGFQGAMSLHTRRREKDGAPSVFDTDKTRLKESDGKPYGGCYVDAVVDVWAQDNAFGKRVNATLAGVKFVNDGDAFGGSVAASEDDFDFDNEEYDDLL